MNIRALPCFVILAEELDFSRAAERPHIADAPLAPRYFAYNRCAVWQCALCGRLYLRYVEGGGYFVDRRMRAVQAQLFEDVPLPA
jgi:hypothetical protein